MRVTSITSSGQSFSPKYEVRVHQQPIRDTIVSSMGERVGYGIYVCISYFVLNVVSLLSSFFKRDLTDPVKLCRYFKEDPFPVMRDVLDLVNTNPDKAEEVLMSLAKYIHENKSDFSPYSQEADNIEKYKDSRKNFFGKIDETILSLLLSPEQQEVMEKISDGEKLEGYECRALVCSSANWPYIKEEFANAAREFRNKNNVAEAQKYENAIRFREVQNEIENIRIKFDKGFWNRLLQGIIQGGECQDLNLNGKCPWNNLFPDSKITFGGFIERILFCRKDYVDQLVFDETIAKYCDYLIKILVDIDHPQYQLHSFPRFMVLCQKLKAILLDEKKYEQFRQIVIKMNTAILF